MPASIKWIVLFAALIFVAGNLWSAEPKREAHNDRKEEVHAQQKGTEKSSFFVSGEITTKQDKTEAEENARERDKDRAIRSAVDNAMIEYTFAMVLATGLMFVAAAIQAGLFVWQLRLMNQSIRDGKTVANAAKDAADLARIEFASSHRPMIRIKHLWLASPLTSESPLRIQLIVVNAGTSDAKIEQYDLGLYHTDPGQALPPKLRYEGRARADNNILAGGITCVFQLEAGALSTRELKDILDGSRVMYCAGYVQYLDGLGRYRRTAFYRRFSTDKRYHWGADRGRFVNVENPDPDYEYQD